MNWLALEQELDLWALEDKPVSFWWRDDDAVAATQELDVLLELSSRLDVPVSLAVVPATLEPSLVSRISNNSRVSVLQHGYAHQNQAPAAEKKAEFGQHRNVDIMLLELARGSKQLRESFLQQYLPVFVPPWNRYSVDLASRLSTNGYSGMSAMWARVSNDESQCSFRVVNAHIDPIAWRSDRGFVGLAVALEQIVSHLRLRREYSQWQDEATGLLTHHLDQQAPVWAFCEELIERTRAHAHCRWLHATEIWGVKS